MIIIVAGAIGRFPVGGYAWHDLHYLVGLSLLGHDVYYLEECGEGSWVYNWQTEEVTTDLDYPTDYLCRCLQPFGLDGRWIYRAGERSLGMPLEDFLAVCAKADLLLLLGWTVDSWRPEYDRPRRRIYVDGDPGFTQFRAATGDARLRDMLSRCERHFTIGRRIGRPDCPIPTLGYGWLPTTVPVCLALWPVATVRAREFTTFIQWQSYRDVEFGGVRYGNKNAEFSRFIGLPSCTRQSMRVALIGGKPADLAARGWKVDVGWRVTLTPPDYQCFIGRSRAEFSVAKHGYVASRGGFFSDRNACYLAAGRPVLAQDTGLADWLPVGEGVLTFDTAEQALSGIEAINADYRRHRRAARALAERVFATERVLPDLLERAMD
jgi:hypothetical protein